MEQPYFIKHLPLMFKIFTCLDVGKKQFNNFFLILRFLTFTFFLSSTISCMPEGKGFHLNILKLHDLLFFFILISNDICLINKRAQVSTLIDFLKEPLTSTEQNTVRSKIVKDYNMEMHVYCKVVASTYFSSVSLWYLASFVIVFVTANDEDGECIHLALGWVWSSESYSYLIFLNFVWTFINMQNFFMWYFVLFCTVIKIKFKTKLLCADLELVNESVESEGCLESNCYGMALQSFLEELQMRSYLDSRVTNPRENNASRLQRISESMEFMEHNLQQYLRGRMVKKQVRLYTKLLVEQHLNIIKYVKLTDETYRLSILVYVQLGIIMLALAIPKISFSDEFLRPEYTNRLGEVLAIVGIVGLFNCFGQIILDESEKLHQALFNCDWTNKHHSLKQGLLIMQTAATNPLRLTLGGMYTLSMETYGQIARATYSYTSLIQTFNFMED